MKKTKVNTNFFKNITKTVKSGSTFFPLELLLLACNVFKQHNFKMTVEQLMTYKLSIKFCELSQMFYFCLNRTTAHSRLGVFLKTFNENCGNASYEKGKYNLSFNEKTARLLCDSFCPPESEHVTEHFCLIDERVIKTVLTRFSLEDLSKLIEDEEDVEPFRHVEMISNNEAVKLPGFTLKVLFGLILFMSERYAIGNCRNVVYSPYETRDRLINSLTPAAIREETWKYCVYADFIEFKEKLITLSGIFLPEDDNGDEDYSKSYRTNSRILAFQRLNLALKRLEKTKLIAFERVDESICGPKGLQITLGTFLHHLLLLITKDRRKAYQHIVKKNFKKQVIANNVMPIAEGYELVNGVLQPKLSFLHNQP